MTIDEMRELKNGEIVTDLCDNSYTVEVRKKEGCHDIILWPESMAEIIRLPVDNIPGEGPWGRYRAPARLRRAK